MTYEEVHKQMEEVREMIKEMKENGNKDNTGRNKETK